jgi:hypothetical protein
VKQFTHTSTQTKQALSFYEYCFPDSDAAQEGLDQVRFASLCNLSLCYLRMGLLRDAEAIATQVTCNDSPLLPHPHTSRPVPTSWCFLIKCHIYITSHHITSHHITSHHITSHQYRDQSNRKLELTEYDCGCEWLI